MKYFMDESYVKVKGINYLIKKYLLEFSYNFLVESIVIKILLCNKCQGDMITNIFKPKIFFSLSLLQVDVINHKTFLFSGQSYLKHGIMRFSAIGLGIKPRGPMSTNEKT
jgi:hypothetical protein